MKKPNGKSKSSAADLYIKKLAANDRPTRDDALKSLTQFLSKGQPIERMELLKLWKGLFFTMWFSDRPRTQQRLADDMANLLQTVQKINFFPFLEAFWSIMAREWDGIDKHRVDKFYLLMRRYLAATLRRLQAEKWDNEWIAQYQIVMSQYPLNARDAKIPNGIRLHIFDIYIDEIERVLGENNNEDDDENDENELKYPEVPFDALLLPIKEISINSPLKLIRERAKLYVLEDERLVEWGVVKKETEEIDQQDDDDEWAGFD